MDQAASLTPTGLPLLLLPFLLFSPTQTDLSSTVVGSRPQRMRLELEAHLCSLQSSPFPLPSLTFLFSANEVLGRTRWHRVSY